MSVWQYVAPWMQPAATLPPRPRPIDPNAAAFTPPRHVPQLADDPTFCCTECEDLTALIGAVRRGERTEADLDAAIAARTCTRSPIGAP